MVDLIVEKIENGTVIDHIPAGMGLKVLELLKLTNAANGNRVALLMNVASKRSGKKDIVKIAGKQLDEKEANKLALVADGATLNIVRNSEVVGKSTIRLPRFLSGISKCPNPKCMTNAPSEKGLSTKFNEEEGKFRCGYCEMLVEAKELIV